MQGRWREAKKCLRETVLFRIGQALTWSAELVDEHLCLLGKRNEDRANLEKGVAHLLQAIRLPHSDIDRWVESACTESSPLLEEVNDQK